ncbi:MAG: hypothetical protein ABWJ42_01535 [Sulfolobales archaeon]
MSKRYIELYDERSSSRRGLHKRRRIALKICGEKIDYADGERIKIKPLYVVGEAYLIKTYLEKECYAAQVDLVMNLRKKVKGYISIYDSTGQLLLKMKYVKLKFRIVEGDSKYKGLFMRVIEFLKIPYRSINWRKQARIKTATS